MSSKKDILKTKKECLIAVEQELVKTKQRINKQETKLNKLLSQIREQSKAIKRKWLNVDDNVGDEKKMDDDENENGLVVDLLEQTKLLESKLAQMRVLMCIGKTGLGKSTFLNRMIGDTSEEGDQGVNINLTNDHETEGELRADHDDNIDYNYFKVGHEVESETSDVCHKFHQHKYDDRLYCLVDTPGSSDSYGRDNQHTNNIAEYLRGCGGVNAFLIFVNLADARVDIEYIKLLKLYNNMLNDNKNKNKNACWWKHVIIIGTNYDVFLHKERHKLARMNDCDREEYLKGRGQQIINLFKNKKELGIPRGLPMVLVPIGHDNYQDAIEDVLSHVQGYKFNCDKIVSPLNKLQSQAFEQEIILNDSRSQANTIRTRKQRIEAEIKSILISQQIQSIANSIQDLSASK